MTTEAALRSVILPFTAALIARAILDLHHWASTGVALALVYIAGVMSQRLKGQN